MKLKNDIVGTEVEFVLDGNVVSAVIKSVKPKKSKAKKTDSKKKPEVVKSKFSPELVRYIRRYDDEWPWLANTPKISNLGGITLVAVIDYEAMTIDIAYSTAAPTENFSRQVGYQIASRRMYEDGDLVTLDYDPARSVVQHFMEWVKDGADHMTKKIVREAQVHMGDLESDFSFY